jgi:hypothetical protein
MDGVSRIGCDGEVWKTLEEVSDLPLTSLKVVSFPHRKRRKNFPNKQQSLQMHWTGGTADQCTAHQRLEARHAPEKRHACK